MINGYTDFAFINRFGGGQHQGTLNKAIRRIIRDCNLYHKDVSTTLDIYLDVAKEFARRKFKDLDGKLRENMESARYKLHDVRSGKEM